MLSHFHVQSRKCLQNLSCRAPSHLRAMSLRRRKKPEDNQGVERITTPKTKDPDSEFMKLWKSTENHQKRVLNKTIFSGKRQRIEKPQKVNMRTLPRESDLTKQAASELIEDSDKIGFRVPKFSEIVQSLGLSKQSDGEIKTTYDIGNNAEEIHDENPEGSMTFEELGIHPKLIARLEKDGIFQPALIQQRALPLIANNQSVLIKSETGSGKTLVFLLPTVQDPGRSFGTVIIVPTRELASQMLYEAHRLLGDKSIVASFVSGVDLVSQDKRLQNTTSLPRIVIGTPKRLLELAEENESLFHRTKRIVVDEVDKIFLPLHKRASRKKMISRAVHPRPGRALVEKLAKISKVPKKQFIGASATVDSSLLEDLSDVGWGDHVTVVQSPSYEGKLQSIPACIDHCYTVYSENLDLSKANVIARTFSNSGQKSALVFIHRSLSVDDFVWELRYLGIHAVSLYRKIATQSPASHEAFLSDFHSGKFQIVVGTGETVRGLDFKDLEHVYLTEVPKNVGEYLHLAGRVGRQGKPGTVTTIVSRDVSGEERRMLLQYRRLGVSFKQV